MRKCYLLSGAAILGCFAFWAASTFARTDPCPAGPTEGCLEEAPEHCPPSATKVREDSPRVPPPGPAEFCESQSEPPLFPERSVPPLTKPDTLTTPATPPLTEPATFPLPTKPLPVATTPSSASPVEAVVRLGDRHQESSVRLSWIGPETAPIARPTDYILAVRNTCSAPVQGVRVEVHLPQGLSVTATSPEADRQEALLRWELGTLTPGQRQDLQVRIVPHTRGQIVPKALVRFTGAVPLPLRALEPRLNVQVAASGEAREGGRTAFVIQVTNPGDGPARGVRIRAFLSEGLDCGTGSPLTFDVGDLAPGHNRCLTVPCAVRTGGLQWCKARASAEGDLSATDTAQIRVAVPRLEVKMDGPEVRYIGRKALYTFTVRNTGPAPAHDVILKDHVPEGLEVVAASGEGRHDATAQTVSWALGEIPGGQSRTVKLEVRADRPGDHRQRCAVDSSSGARAEDGVLTRVRGLSALQLELVDRDDPVEVDAENVYEVRISNTGSAEDRDIRLVASFPDGMEFLGADGPTRYLRQDGSVVFEPLPRLDPRSDARYHIRVRTSRPGTYRFQIEVTSAHITKPIIEMEATRIYADHGETLSPRP